jgi:hypothetical protein
MDAISPSHFFAQFVLPPLPRRSLSPLYFTDLDTGNVCPVIIRCRGEARWQFSHPINRKLLKRQTKRSQMFAPNLNLMSRETHIKQVISTVRLEFYGTELTVGKQPRATIRQFHPQRLDLGALVPTQAILGAGSVTSMVANVTALHNAT